ncbi:MAG: hypothetical protein KGJ84_15140 [Elusimicrobia bacterium]|nr:hypothetical protein [Elusimicrobiota bacterium]
MKFPSAGRVLAALGLALCAVRARAVPVFNPENPVVFSSAAPQAFTGAYPTLRMYFIRPSSRVQVGSALSADGVAWAEDAGGGRLSTTTLPSVSASSVTGCGILPLSGGGFRMLYSIVSTTGAYRIHSATSTDGLGWANDTGTRVDNGAVYLGSPKLVKLSDASWRLYYVSGAPVANRQILTSRSTDQGWTWSTPTIAVSTLAYEVGASVLTNGKVRLYYTEPLNGAPSSATVVASALSRTSAGTIFDIESGYRVSTAAASGGLGFPVPVQSTDSFRWRLYYDFGSPGVISTADVHTALTGVPAPAAITPSYVINNTSTQTVTVSGDVFSPTPTVALVLAGQPSIPGTALTRVDDQTITASFNILNAAVGRWDVVVTNADGTTATLPAAETIDFAGGTVSLVNNLLRPRTGAVTTITITAFNDGSLTARLFTLDGRPVSTLYSGAMAKGTQILTWDGRDAGGVAVASGVYLLRILGPHIDVKDKIVVIR